VTDSMRAAIDETERRRHKQIAYNEAHGITPRGIVKAVKEIIDGVHAARAPSRGRGRPVLAAEEEAEYRLMKPEALAKVLNRLEKQMHQHACNREFEQAATVRDKIRALRERNFGVVSGGRR